MASVQPAGDQVAAELARAEELVDKGESWQALTELWEASNVAPNDPAVLTTILDKLNSVASRGAFERDRFVDDEVATAASESISSLTSRLERDIELARQTGVQRGLATFGEAGLSALATVA